MAEKYWLGDAPDRDDITQEPIVDEFIDGKTTHGPWGFMLPETHKVYGYGLGTGRGQRYQKQDNGRWLKVEG